jgi:hypothetical protein
MKIGLFCCLLFLLNTSCQNGYSKDFIEHHLRLNKQLERSNQLIKKNTSAIIKKAHIEILKMPHYGILESKSKEVTLLSNTFYNEVEVVKKQFENNFQEQQAIKVLELLHKKAQNYYKESILLVENSWDNGGIKGCIFADITKKQTALKQVKEDIGIPIFQQLNANTFSNKKNQPLAVILTQIHVLQNDIRRQENNLIRFFCSQISSYCGYDRFDVYASSQKNCIRLGETYEAGICFGDYAPISLLHVSVDKDSLPIVENRVRFQIEPKQLGEQAYRATVKFQHILSQEIGYQEQLFYFEVRK